MSSPFDCSGYLETQPRKVTPSVGPEQEYFIVDREKYFTEKRPDLHRPYLIRSNASKRPGDG